MRRSDLEKVSCSTLGATCIDFYIEVVLHVAAAVVFKSCDEVVLPQCEPSLKADIGAPARLEGNSLLQKGAVYCKRFRQHLQYYKNKLYVTCSPILDI